MRKIVLTIAALGISGGVAVAQGQSGQQSSPSPGAPSVQQGSQMGQQASPSDRRGRSAQQSSQSDAQSSQQSSQTAQNGPQNPAIKSTDQNNSSTPVAGANSFTEAQAKARIEARGYTNVSGLKKDDSGVWRGTATLNGQTRPVSLDYQGNVN
jgi:hypothetical protein